MSRQHYFVPLLRGMTSVELYQYVIHFAVMMTILTSMAVYLLVSKRNAFGSEIVTDQRLRRKAGWMILSGKHSALFLAFRQPAAFGDGVRNARYDGDLSHGVVLHA